MNPHQPVREPLTHYTIPVPGANLHLVGSPGRRPEAPGLFFVPGYSDHVGRYDAFLEYLATQGLTVWGMDLRGHGRSGGARGVVERFSDYRDDLRRALQAAAEVTPVRRWVLVGHSTGGLVVLSSLLRAGGDALGVAAAAVTSPLLELRLPVSPWQFLVGWVGSALAPRMVIHRGLPGYANTHDEDVERARREDPNAFFHVNVRWFVEARREMRYVRARAAGVRVPLLGLQAGDDRVVKPAAARAFVEACPAGRYIEYPHLYHEILLETERRRVWDDLLAWLAGIAA